jgi:ABC-type sugar transport system substrate-binding protein
MGISRFKWGKTGVLLLAVVVLAVVVAACGGGSSSSTTESTSAEEGSGSSTTAAEESGSGGEIEIDLGNQTLTFPAGTKPTIGVFAGSGIAYQAAYQETFPKLAEKYGISITYNDSKFDPTTQLEELKSAVQSKKYNAWIVENYTGASACNIITKEAPAAEIVVSMITNPTCDVATEPAGEKYWSPGTLNTVGGASSETYYANWVEEAKELMGEEKEVGVISGPPLVPATENMEAGFDENGIKPVAFENSNYTTPEAQEQTAAILQAHSGLGAMFSVGPDVTVGIVNALKAAGKKPGEVEVFEVGGATANLGLIEEGWLTMSIPYSPVTVAETAVEQIMLAFEGEQGPRYLQATAPGSVEEPYEITKETVAEYKKEAQY